MNNSHTTKIIAACALLVGANASFAHVVLGDPAALAGTSYRAALRVGHGCDGSPVTALRVTLPDGFMGAKPMPKAGWVLSVKSTKGLKAPAALLDVIESGPAGHSH